MLRRRQSVETSYRNHRRRRATRPPLAHPHDRGCGHPSPIRTLVDIDLGQFDEVWAAGGHPHYVFPTTFDELVRITGGTPADVGA